MRTFIVLLTIAFTGFGLPALAQDSPSAAEILERVDRVATQAKDFTAKVELVTVDAKGNETKRSLDVWQKGHEQRMLKVSRPARLKGVGMLATGPDELYMYLPSFGRVRRVAGRKRGQPFLGSNFTQDDMARTAYRPRFEPKLAGQDDETWTLRLQPKKPADEPHDHLIITVRKSDAIVARIDFYDEGQKKPTRRLEASDIKSVDGATLAHRLTMVDLADGSRSTAVLESVEIDTGLDDSLFSKRQLTRRP